VATLQSGLVCHHPKVQEYEANTLLANPTLLGLIGFLIPYTSTILILCGFQGAVAPQSLVGLSGDYYFFGCIAMNVAGIAEFILGNSTSFTLMFDHG
jgi:succinate-acetate transporter protein